MVSCYEKTWRIITSTQCSQCPSSNREEVKSNNIYLATIVHNWGSPQSFCKSPSHLAWGESPRLEPWCSAGRSQDVECRLFPAQREHPGSNPGAWSLPPRPLFALKSFSSQSQVPEWGTVKIWGFIGDNWPKLLKKKKIGYDIMILKNDQIGK